MPTLPATLAGLSLALLAVAGCGPSEHLDTAEKQYSQTMANAFTLNAFTLNAFTLNAFTLNAFSLNAFTLNGVDLSSARQGGEPLSSVELNNTRLRGARAATYLNETDLSGVTMDVEVTNGQTAQLRLDKATWNSSVAAYTYTVSLSTDQGWVRPCGVVDGQPVPILFLAGSWDMSTGASLTRQNRFTPACFNSALAKCVLWGYSPWAQVDECVDGLCVTQKVADWHQACTRMVRADYCGDGRAHTRNGSLIDPWDSLGIQIRSPETWETEAEWGVDGASCIRHTRWVTSSTDPSGAETDLAYVKRVCPSRLAANNPTGCDPAQSTFVSSIGIRQGSKRRQLIRNSSPPPQ